MREVGVPTYNLYGSTPIIREPFSKNVFHGAIVPVEVASHRSYRNVLRWADMCLKKFGVLAGTYAFPQARLKAVVDVLKEKKARLHC